MSDVIRQLLAEDRRLPTYRPSLRKITGSALSAILLSQIIFWDEIKKGEPFYKFIFPCEHKACQTGDTWSDELGFSRSEFNTALKKIGKRIKPSEVNEIDMENDDAALVYYWTDVSRLTYYWLNRTALHNAISWHYETPDDDTTKVHDMALDHTETTTETSTETTTDQDFYVIFIQEWIRNFPKKPKPRRKTVRDKLKTRFKDSYFEENWVDALERVSGSDFCNNLGWFDAHWFLKNDTNWENCLNGKYDNREDKSKQQSRHMEPPPLEERVGGRF